MLLQAPQRVTDVEALFRLHEQPLARFLFGIVGDVELAEDLLQETFLAACARPGRLETVTAPEVWLFSVARHLAMSALRKRYRFSSALVRVRSRSRERAPVQMAVPSSARGALELLARLSPDDRALVLLRYWYGFQSPEIAEITGRSAAAVRKRLERSLAALAVEFEGGGR
jgi:RNA polymerase sigma-70 factor (ECF subfamily)